MITAVDPAAQGPLIEAVKSIWGNMWATLSGLLVVVVPGVAVVVSVALVYVITRAIKFWATGL